MRFNLLICSFTCATALSPLSLLILSPLAQAEPLPITPRTLSEVNWTAAPITPSAAQIITAGSASISQADSPKTDFSPIPFQGRVFFSSGPGVGYESSFAGLEGFVPLTQTPGKNLTYVQAQLSLAVNGGNPSGNVLLGYRRFDPNRNSILGGYIGYDIRDTGRATFNQLGAGIEGLWPGFEARINGYLPISNTRDTVDHLSWSSSSTTSATSSAPNDLRFQGNNLLLGLAQTTTLTTVTNSFRFQRDEIALSGLDAEVGVKLVAWKPDGDLRSYLGVYYYSGSGVGGFVGVRGRLVTRINQYASVGLSVQGDPEFGTTAAVTVGLTFPGISRNSTPENTSNWARMGDSPNRLNTIAVTERTDTNTTTTTASTSTTTNTTQVVLNPSTGQPWVFEHVVLGGTGGNGTYENPFSTVALAMTATPGDGNGIVYVQPGTNPGIPAFTIKDNVQVLSTGPVQTIPSQVGTLQLPLSGSGTLPQVTGTVSMGTNTVLSGFAITPPAGNPGILASGVRTVTIRDNQVNASGNNTPGIRLQNVTGTATVNNNTVATTGTAGPPPAVGSQGIVVDATNTPLPTLVVRNNRITTAGQNAHGIFVVPQTNSPITDATVSENTITTAGQNAEGIYFLSNNSAITNAIISTNIIRATGLNAEGIVVINQNNSPIANLTIANNTATVSGNAAAGIWVQPAGSAITNATISGNVITTTGNSAGNTSHGIFLRGGFPITNLTISSNTVTTTGTGSIGILRETGSTSLLTLSNNRILQSASHNVQINSASALCAVITGNLTQNPGGGSFNFNLLSGLQPFRVVNLATVSANNNGAVFRFDGGVAPLAPFTSVPSCP